MLVVRIILHSIAFFSLSSQEKVQRALARAIYVSGQPLALVEHPLWREFFKLLKPDFSLPTRKTLGTKLLDEEYSKIKVEIDEKINEAQVIHIALDGWTNIRNEPIVNIILYTPTPYFYDFIETKQNKHTAEYLFQEVCKIIDKIGSDKIMLIITDNATNMVKCGKMLETKYPHVKWAGCLAHTLHLIVGDILKNQQVTKLFSDIIDIIKCIQRSHILSADFKSTAQNKGVTKSLKLPVKTRWGSHLNCVQSLLECKSVLQNMALNSPGVQKYKNLLLNEDEWMKFEKIKILLKPIVDWITKLEGDYCSIHLIHTAFSELKELLEKPTVAEILGEEAHSNLKQKFGDRKATALKPMHYAAVLLNPQKCGTTMTPTENIDGWEFVLSLAERHSISVQQLFEEVSEYKCSTGLWSKEFIWETAKKVKPVAWWQTLYSKTELGAIALKILTAPATSASVERSFSTFSNIHTKKRNKFNTERAGKICLIAHNWKIMNKPKPLNQESEEPKSSTSATREREEPTINLDNESEESTSEEEAEDEPVILTETDQINLDGVDQLLSMDDIA